MTNRPKAIGTARYAQYAPRFCACGCGERPRNWAAQYVVGHKPPLPLADRLWRRAEKMPSGCWEWRGYVRPAGYGQIGRGRKGQGIIDTHRAAWELTNGPIPGGLFVCHKCDNRRCCNPEHLFLGTHQDNMRDMRAKGRGARGFDLPHTRLSEEQVREIRARFVSRHHPGLRGHWRSNARELATEFGITPQYLTQVVYGHYRKDAA